MQKFDNRQDIADIESIKIDFLTFSEDGKAKESKSEVTVKIVNCDFYFPCRSRHLRVNSVNS